MKKALVNEYFHNRVPVNVENQVIIRSNVDLIYSYAVVDVTEEATISAAPSDEYQVRQLIDEDHSIVGVVYPGQLLTITNDDLNRGNQICIVGRTATSGGLDRPLELQDLSTIEAATSNPYVAPDFDEESRLKVGEDLEKLAAEADYSLGFGTPESRERFQQILCARLGWGWLSPQHAQYYQALATSTGWEVGLRRAASRLRQQWLLLGYQV